LKCNIWIYCDKINCHF